MCELCHLYFQRALITLEQITTVKAHFWKKPSTNGDINFHRFLIFISK